MPGMLKKLVLYFKSQFQKGKRSIYDKQEKYSDDFGTHIAGVFSDDTLKRKYICSQ